MKLYSLLLAPLFLSSLTASAVTISVDAEVLKDQHGNPMPQSGIVVLTAGTHGTFNGPLGSSFVTGDELLLATWDLSAWGFDGVFSGLTASLAFTGDWDQGDPLRLYWYPSLTLSDTGPSAGIFYGAYTDATGIDGSAPWITPAESDNISLGLYTSDAFFLRDGTAAAPFGGSNDPSAGVAAHQVAGVAANPVPDAGGTLLLFAVGLAGIHRLRKSCDGVQRSGPDSNHGFPCGRVDHYPRSCERG